MGKASRLKREKRELLALLLEAQQARPIRTDRAGIWRRISLIGKAVIGFAIVIFGIYAGYVGTLRPRILIEPPSTLVDPQNPSNAPFILINDGSYSVYSVVVDCRPTIVAARPITANETSAGLRGKIRHDVFNLDELPSTARRPVVCKAFQQIEPRNLKIVGVEVRVTVSVSPFSFFNWRHVKSVLFEADSDGATEFEWHELRVGEKPHFPMASVWMGM